jgi:hypothetical protein
MIIEMLLKSDIYKKIVQMILFFQKKIKNSTLLKKKIKF